MRFWRTGKCSRAHEQQKNSGAHADAHRSSTIRLIKSPALQTRIHSPDCTLTETMFFSDKPLRAAAGTALAGLIFAGILQVDLGAQTLESVQLPATEPTSIALP